MQMVGIKKALPVNCMNCVILCNAFRLLFRESVVLSGKAFSTEFYCHLCIVLFE